jgi:hypothetical protein
VKLLAALVALPFLGTALLVFSFSTFLAGPGDGSGAACSGPAGLSGLNVSSASPSAADQGNAQQQAAGSASQKQNLDTIIGQAKAYGLSAEAAIDAVTAGLAESGLDNHETASGQAIVTNLDSVGVFQERPSQGWGTQQQILDVGYATDKWLQYLLTSVQGWQSMAPAAVAQAVERSADPQRYAQFAQQATTWVDQDWAGTPGAAPVLSRPGEAPAPSKGAAPSPGSTPSPPGEGLEGSTSCASLGSAAQSVISTLTAAQEGGLWPVQLPVPAPGWEQQVSLPRWPASEAAGPPTAVSNQCVAGAEWAYDLIQHSTYRFPSANGVDVAREAAAHGLQASTAPAVGDVVSFNIPGSSAGHVALVIATSPTAFEVVEQNWLQDNAYQGQWSSSDWDIRSVAWPNNSVVGFAGPPPPLLQPPPPA